MAEKKRTTAPLTPDEVAEALTEIPEEEFLSRFDEIWAKELDLPEKLGELITLDDYMDNELREMFQSIIAQYIGPIAGAVARVREGDHAKRTAQEGLDALAPILSASESLDYKDIAADLKQVERPLSELANGMKRRLSKREVAELGEAWDRIDARLRPEGARETPSASPGLSLSGLTRLDGVTAEHVRSLRGAGLSTLGDLASAPTADVVAVSGLPESVAERARAFAIGASAVSGSPVRRKPAPVPAGWVRVRVEGEAFKGTFTIDAARLGRYLEPVLERLAEDASAPKPKRAAAPRRAKPAAAKPVAKKRTTK